MSVRFAVKDVRASGRTARGVRGIRLGDGDSVISALTVTGVLVSGLVLTLSENGFGKKTKVDAFKVQKRGGVGIKAAAITAKTGRLVGAHILGDEESEIITMSKNGQMVRVGTNEISQLGRQTQGVSVMKLKGGDILTASTHM